MDRLIDQISQVKRPLLGEDIPILVFRAFRVFVGLHGMDIMGEKGMTALIQNAGRELGKELGETLKHEDLDKYLMRVIDFVRDAKIGLLVPVEVNQERMVLQLDECITCSGMPNIGKKICQFEVGIVAGLVESYLHKRVKAYETKCNANGDNICEVNVELNNF